MHDVADRTRRIWKSCNRNKDECEHLRLPTIPNIEHNCASDSQKAQLIGDVSVAVKIDIQIIDAIGKEQDGNNI